MTQFNIFITAYNAEPWIEVCLLSVERQYGVEDLMITLVNDASTDGTAKAMDAFISQYQHLWIKRTTNSRNMKKSYNLSKMREGNPEDVIIMLDGDDQLWGRTVLDKLNAIYNDPKVWMTYGNYTRTPDPSFMPNPALPYPPDVVKNGTFRQCDFYHNHLRTFKRHLLQQISDAELQDSEGNWFTCGDDHAIMMPMLEMSRNGHYVYIPDVLYVYNEGNPTSDFRTKAAELDRVHSIINKRSPRAPLY